MPKPPAMKPEALARTEPCETLTVIILPRQGKGQAGLGSSRWFNGKRTRLHPDTPCDIGALNEDAPIIKSMAGAPMYLPEDVRLP